MKFTTKIKTALKLGIANLFRVYLYRTALSLRLHPVCYLTSLVKGDTFFYHTKKSLKLENYNCYEYRPFGWMNAINLKEINWHKNYLTNKISTNSNKPWYQIPDFDNDLGDIKGIWEASRFNWAIGFAKDFLSGNEKALDSLNEVIKDWVDNNQPYNGPNWKCGQEASIRVLNLAFTAMMLDQEKKTKPALLALIKSHLNRIFPTMSYAIGQQNNHGVSEAAALFVGGGLLSLNGQKDGRKYEIIGRNYLENTAKNLILNDGTFSQYSTNYQRFMLDAYSMAELWRRHIGREPFSNRFIEKLCNATKWLYRLVDKHSGDVPNIGHNDGSHIFNILGCDYRDFRPSVQLASILFLNATAWKGHRYNYDLEKLLNIRVPKKEISISRTFIYDDGGFIGIENKNKLFVLLRYPKFKFRPAHNDCLHIDLWFKGKNILCDGGTYSYNAGDELNEYYSGSEGHNTVRFYGHQQMPRISRFLFSDWPNSIEASLNEKKFSAYASFKDSYGCLHDRKVLLNSSSLEVNDIFKGTEGSTLLRWRLCSGNWKIDGNRVYSNNCEIIVYSKESSFSLKLKRGSKSRYYYLEKLITVLEIESSTEGSITTKFKFKS